MKRLNNSQPLSVTMIYRPLTTVLKIVPIGHLPTTQFYSQAAQEWVPDHTKSPSYDAEGLQVDGVLRLKADYFVQDEDGLIDPSDIPVQVFWYVDKEQVSTSDTAKDFYLVGSDLYVRKNFTHLAGVNVYCEMLFNDPRTNQPIVLNDTLVLNAVLRAKEQWLINLLCDRTRKHYPLHAATTVYDFEAEARHGAMLKNDEVAWFWDYSLDNGATFKTIDTTCLWYVSGKNTHKLTIDIDYIEDIMVRARIGVANGKTTAAPDLPNEATASMSWRMPNLKPEVFSYGGNRIFAENTSMRFGLFVHVAKHSDMTEAEKRQWLLTNWAVRRQGSTAAPIILDEHGLEVDIAQRFLMNNALGKFIPDPQLGLRGVYDQVAFGDEPIQLSNGEFFAIRS